MAHPSVGTRILDYEILEELGRGGMGAVYRARHVELGVLRALKLVRTDASVDQAAVAALEREGRILGGLNSPFVVALLELHHQEDGTLVLVMELLRGESALARVRRSGRLPVLEALCIAREAAQGLDAAHCARVIHRDVSPANLFLARDDSDRQVTKVIDFGIARVSAGGAGVTISQDFSGTLDYCSPEQCGLSGTGRLDHRTDVYSLGATLYHLLAGRPPFSADSPFQYMYKHASEPPVPPSRHLPAGTLPGSVDELVLSCLAKKRDDRPQSMRELAIAIDRAVLAVRESESNPVVPSARALAAEARRAMAREELARPLVDAVRALDLPRRPRS